jgi:hypothetical protein
MPVGVRFPTAMTTPVRPRRPRVHTDTDIQTDTQTDRHTDIQTHTRTQTQTHNGGVKVRGGRGMSLREVRGGGQTESSTQRRRID